MVKTILQEFRVHHWTKNILIFFPVIISETQITSNVVINCLLCFISFSLIASAIYMLNDIIDYNRDLLHPFKKNRPYAAGKIKKLTLIYNIIIFVIIGIFISLSLSYEYFFIIIVYISLNIIYFFFLKKIIFIDTLTLVLFYILRVEAGLIVNDISFSYWLISFLFFLFLSLSFFKKYIDVKVSKNSDNELYSKKHEKYLIFSGITTGILSSLLIYIFAENDLLSITYGNVLYFKLITPVLIIWIILLWRDGIKNKVSTDLISYILKRKSNYFILLIVGFLYFLSLA